ncbi:MAG: microcompartment protein [Ignavibacteriae bacterium]|nr:MAG: microcompartment protein [Ignavibacteriota bacterium]
MNLALGLIETKGLVGAIEAADAMVKAADVKIISKEKVTGALIIIKVVGETAAVKSAVDAGVAAANRIGELIGAHVIPRPDDQIDSLLKESSSVSNKSNKSDKPNQEKNNVTNKNSNLKSKPKEANYTKQGKQITESKKEETEKNIQKELPTMEELEILNVHSLRKIARSFNNFPIKGRDISKANRGTLLDYFKTML